MSIFDAVIIAIVEGLTEFLPISSTGHMILAASVLGTPQDTFTKTFEIFIQFGAILSVLVFYYKRFLQVDFKFYLKLLAAFIPTGILGLLLDDYVDAMMSNILIVAYSLLIGGILLLFVDRWFKNNTKTYANFSYLDAALMGVFQALAMIPGVSRSAATIIGAQTKGLTKKSAAEFSFFLAVPTMAAASGYKLLKGFDSFPVEQLNVLLIGSAVAFVVALIAIKYFIEFLTKYGFKVFGIYRIVIGLLIIILHYLDIPLTMF